MTETQKKRSWLLLPILLLLVLLVVVLLAPRLIGTERFKGQIQSAFKEQTGGQLDYRGLELFLLPVPGFEVDQVQINMPGRLEGRVEVLRVYPELLPLLRGEVRLAGLELASPDLTVMVPGDVETTRTDDAPAATANLAGVLAPGVELLARHAPALDVKLGQGQLRLSRQAQSWLELQRVDLEFSLRASADGTAAAEIDSSIGALRLHQGKKKIELEKTVVAGTVRFADGDLKVSLAKMTLAQPALQLSGELAIETGAPAARLDLRGQQIDVAATRALVLALAGEDETVKDIFSYLRGGTVEEISFSSRGKRFAELGDLPQIKLQGRLKDGAIAIPPLQMDLEAVNGEVTIADGILSGSGLSARLDDSTGRDGQLKIDLADTAGPFHLDLQVDADLKQLHTILDKVVHHVEFVEELKRITQIKGRGRGRLILGDSLDSLVAGVDVQELTLSADYERLPFPVSIARGKLSFSGDRIEITKLAGEIGASRFADVSFRLDWHEHFSLAASSGKFWFATEQLGPWLKSFPELQGPLTVFHKPAGELQLVTTGLSWQPATGYSVKGSLVFPRGPEVALDVVSDSAGLQVRQLVIRDQDSQARLSCTLRQRELELSFSGKLQQKTLDNLFLSAGAGDGWLEGDFKIRTALDQVEQSTASGALKAGNIQLSRVMKDALTIRRLDLAAQQNQVTVKAAELVWGKNEISLGGSIDIDPAGLLLDLDAEAGDLVWIPEREESVAPPGPTEEGAGLPEISGSIRLKAASFTLGGLTWQPLQADISLQPDRTDIRVDQAELCGISSPGTLVITQGQLDLDFKLTAKNQEIAPRYACLTNDRVKMTGSFDLDGEIAADGPAGELLQNARGKVVLEARDGRIIEDRSLARILEVINVTEIVKGKLPNLATDGFDYESISVEAELQGKTLLLNKYQMDGKSLDLLGQGSVDLVEDRIDAQVMAAPFKTVDTVIKHLPGINYLLAGSLVAIPVSIQGSLHDPQVRVMAPSAIGSGLLGLAERVIKSPVKLIESALPEEKEP